MPVIERNYDFPCKITYFFGLFILQSSFPSNSFLYYPSSILKLIDFSFQFIHLSIIISDHLLSMRPLHLKCQLSFVVIRKQILFL